MQNSKALNGHLFLSVQATVKAFKSQISKKSSSMSITRTELDLLEKDDSVKSNLKGHDHSFGAKIDFAIQRNHYQNYCPVSFFHWIGLISLCMFYDRTILLFVSASKVI